MLCVIGPTCAVQDCVRHSTTDSTTNFGAHRTLLVMSHDSCGICVFINSKFYPGLSTILDCTVDQNQFEAQLNFRECWTIQDSTVHSTWYSNMYGMGAILQQAS